MHNNHTTGSSGFAWISHVSGFSILKTHPQSSTQRESKRLDSYRNHSNHLCYFETFFEVFFQGHSHVMQQCKYIARTKVFWPIQFEN